MNFTIYNYQVSLTHDTGANYEANIAYVTELQRHFPYAH